VNTVRHHLKGDTPPRYQRTRRKATKLRPVHGYLAERQKKAQPGEVKFEGCFPGISGLFCMLLYNKTTPPLDTRKQHGMMRPTCK
jgi:hypothetical protein